MGLHSLRNLSAYLVSLDLVSGSVEWASVAESAGICSADLRHFPSPTSNSSETSEEHADEQLRMGAQGGEPGVPMDFLFVLHSPPIFHFLKPIFIITLFVWIEGCVWRSEDSLHHLPALGVLAPTAILAEVSARFISFVYSCCLLGESVRHSETSWRCRNKNGAC